MRVAQEGFEEEMKGVALLPELEFQLEDHKVLIEKMIQCYQEAFADQGIQVVQPECEFDVPLEGTEHNCIWLHHGEYIVTDHNTTLVEQFGPPSPEAILERRVAPAHDRDPSCFCWQPHRFVGKTDAVVVWMNNIWLLEHKTTAISGEQFWSQWRLDIQPTGYIYGIQKATGTRVSGFILNAINKPSEAQVSAWNKKRKYGPEKGVVDYISYSREAFLRSKEDLERFERELIQACGDWERDIVRGVFPHDGFANKGCQQYNRLCEYHSLCSCHDSQLELEALVPKSRDYVDVKMLRLAGLKIEEEVTVDPTRAVEVD